MKASRWQDKQYSLSRMHTLTKTHDRFVQSVSMCFACLQFRYFPNTTVQWISLDRECMGHRCFVFKLFLSNGLLVICFVENSASWSWGLTILRRLQMLCYLGFLLM